LAAVTSSAGSPGQSTAWTAPPAIHGHARTVINALASGRIGEEWRPHPRAIGHRDARGGRAIHPPSRDAASRKRPRGHFRRWHRQPYFSTDTTAALRASEIGADVLLKATKVEGVYTADPKKDPTATKYDKLNYMDALKGRLNVMDSTAFSLCMDNKIPIVVFNLFKRRQH